MREALVPAAAAAAASEPFESRHSVAKSSYIFNF